MDTKQFHRRVWAVVVLLAIVLTSLGSTLYDLQINSGEEYYEQSIHKIAETETVEAGRGQILDRNGRVLVSDKAVYQVNLNTSLMGDAQSRNDTLLSLVRAARAPAGEEAVRMGVVTSRKPSAVMAWRRAATTLQRRIMFFLTSGFRRSR